MNLEFTVRGMSVLCRVLYYIKRIWLNHRHILFIILDKTIFQGFGMETLGLTSDPPESRPTRFYPIWNMNTAHKYYPAKYEVRLTN